MCSCSCSCSSLPARSPPRAPDRADCLRRVGAATQRAGPGAARGGRRSNSRSRSFASLRTTGGLTTTKKAPRLLAGSSRGTSRETRSLGHAHRLWNSTSYGSAAGNASYCRTRAKVPRPIGISFVMVLPDGAEGDRTPDLCSAIAALSQLSYSPLGHRDQRPHRTTKPQMRNGPANRAGPLSATS